MESKSKGGTILTCNECLKGVCAECTITLFIKNEGLMKCPHCRYTIGQRMPPWIVKGAAREMMMNIQESKREYAEGQDNYNNGEIYVVVIIILFLFF